VTERLTRKQRQEHTRACLLEAAARVFARRGLAQASVDEVAADAGFTKGAVYANFGSKEELFLEMLDRKFAARLVDLEAVLKTDQPPEEQARTAGRDFLSTIVADPEWGRLFYEAALHASRNEAFRQKLQASYQQMRARMVELLQARFAGTGFVPPVPYEQLAMMFFSMANGVGFERLVEGDAVPDDLFATMLGLFTRGAWSAQQDRIADGDPA
jgi:AcrR family transcriptional regulator